MPITLSGFAEFGLWSLIVVLAFMMQVAPFLLILTMINIAFGISSATALVVIPAGLLAMLVSACLIAERRRRGKGKSAIAEKPESGEALRNTAPCMLPYVKRQRFY